MAGVPLEEEVGLDFGDGWPSTLVAGRGLAASLDSVCFHLRSLTVDSVHELRVCGRARRRSRCRSRWQAERQGHPRACASSPCASSSFRRVRPAAVERDAVVAGAAADQLVVAAVCEAIDDLAYFDTAVVDDDNNLMDRNSFTVLDLCAGNGGKALGIASHLANRTPRPASGTDREESGRVQSGLEARRTIGEVKKGERVEDQGGRLSRQAHAGWERRVLCYDVNANRLKQIAGSLHRAGLAPSGLSGVQVQVLYSEAELEAAACPRSVDVALVDAPCSSTGALRRHPSLLLYAPLPSLRIFL